MTATAKKRHCCGLGPWLRLSGGKAFRFAPGVTESATSGVLDVENGGLTDTTVLPRTCTCNECGATWPLGGEEPPPYFGQDEESPS